MQGIREEGVGRGGEEVETGYTFQKREAVRDIVLLAIVEEEGGSGGGGGVVSGRDVVFEGVEEGEGEEEEGEAPEGGWLDEEGEEEESEGGAEDESQAVGVEEDG